MSQYYIQLFSPHGLIRFHNPEIGRDKDTGGQVKYVLELVEALSKHPQVRKVDLFTRKIMDKKVSPAYSQTIETINDKARIVRIQCGGNLYREKEQLWDHLNEFINNTIRFIETNDDFPDIVHGHYADGNYIANELSQIFNIPYIATGHSLGRNKRKMLLESGWTVDKLNDKFKINRRIQEEENALQRARFTIVSTEHEINTQYAAYENKAMANFVVIPPGINTEIFYPYYRLGMPAHNIGIAQEQAIHRVKTEIDRFLFNSEKPLILSIGRADKRKNFETIISAYGQDKELQAMANLAIFAGVRKDISMMAEDEREILTNLLLLLDKYDLYGKMAIPKKNDPSVEVPEIYRLAATKKGVFVNGTPGENFGLTLIEAAACGLPVIASPTGGPKEIIAHANNGLLVDVSEPQEIATALKKIIADTALWDQYSTNGITSSNDYYSWDNHVQQYMQLVNEIYKQPDGNIVAAPKSAFGRKMIKATHFLISDLDGTLIDGNDDTLLPPLKKWIKEQKDWCFGIASGRNKMLLQEAMQIHSSLPDPDILICAVGTEIYYTKDFIADSGWESHINYQWKRDSIEKLLSSSYPQLQIQEKEAQNPYKISYYVAVSFSEDDVAGLFNILNQHRLSAKILLTDNKYLDLIPIRAGKGNAIRYLSNKWQCAMENIFTAGNGGNDIDMLIGKSKGIVVANYSPELEKLKGKKNIYFAKRPVAAGVIEGIDWYQAKSPNKTI